MTKLYKFAHIDGRSIVAKALCDKHQSIKLRHGWSIVGQPEKTNRQCDKCTQSKQFKKLHNIYFDGSTYNPQIDRERLASLLERVFALMKDGQWRTLENIQKNCGGTEASVSARLRDFRKDRFGGHAVEHERINEGLWHYRLIPSWKK